MIRPHAVCEALEVRNRDARYVLERGHVPPGISPSPGSGEHRDFSSRQAFWLGMVLKLKEAGLKTPLATQIADYVYHSKWIQDQWPVWHLQYFLTDLCYDADKQCFVEVADSKYIRLATNDRLNTYGLPCFAWQQIEKRGVPIENVRPFVLLRLDLLQIASRLGAAFSVSETS